jgi:hypothetical protein
VVTEAVAVVTEDEPVTEALLLPVQFGPSTSLRLGTPELSAVGLFGLELVEIGPTGLDVLSGFFFLFALLK